MSSPAAADLVLRDGVIYTADARETVATSVAVAGGRIVYVGASEGVRAWIGPRTEVLELKGRMVLPGFHDSHMHPLLGGLNLIECNLAGLETLPAYLEHIRRYARENPSKPFLRGYGWVHGHFPPTGPSRKDLDAVEPDRPVMLKAMDGHSAWVNSKALELARISRETPDPPGGRIERDESGAPSGTLREWAAMDLLKDVFPAPGEAELAQGLRAFMKEAARMGITAVQDAMVSEPFLRLYDHLDADGELNLWVGASLLCEPGCDTAFLEHLKSLRNQEHGRHVRAGAVKLFLDGVMESHTACLLEPYTDRPECRGQWVWEPEAFRRQVTALDRAGFQIHIHAIGDAAIRLALASLTPARREARHMIAHLDLIARPDIPRLSELGVVANVQPAWFYIDNGFFDTAMPYLGSRRAQGMYPVRSLLQSGAMLVCSTDWPFGGDAATFNPLEAITVGRTRCGIGGPFSKPMAPEESLDLPDLLKAYTRNGAWAAYREQETGSLEAGKSADLVVLDTNLFEMPPARLHEARVLMTLFEGRPVHRDRSI